LVAYRESGAGCLTHATNHCPWSQASRDAIDPLAGSYLIEYLTDEIRAQAEAYIQKIDGLGGALEAIDQGYVQREIPGCRL